MAIKLNGSTSGSVALDAPADTSPSGTDVTLTLPTSAGSSGQYLQTNGSGTLSWQTVTDTNTQITWLTAVSLTSQSSVTVTGIDTSAEHIIIALQDAYLNANANEGYRFRFGNGSIVTSANYRYSVGSRTGSNYSSNDDKYMANQGSYIQANNTYEGHLWLSRLGTNNWAISQMLGVRNAGDGPNFGGGSYAGSDYIDRVQLATGTSTYGGGTIRVGYMV